MALLGKAETHPNTVAYSDVNCMSSETAVVWNRLQKTLLTYINHFYYLELCQTFCLCRQKKTKTGWSLGISEEKCTVNIYKFLNGQCISGPVLAITWLANVIRLFPLMIMFQHDDYSHAEFWSQHVPDND